MPLNFEPVSLDNQQQYSEIFAACPQKSSDYSFVNLWGWAQKYGLCWARSDRLIWIKQTIPEVVYWAPVGPWEEIDWNACFDEHFSAETVFSRIPEKLLTLWQNSCENRVVTQEERGHWDYLYSVTELIELKGRRFHKKRNLVNQFRKKYDFEYVPFGVEIIDLALAMQEDWCTWRDCESSEALAAENDVISRILNSWDKLNGLIGGAIVVDGQMVAYTVAEGLSQGSLVIHFEKGNHDFKGVYQAINQMFLEHSGKQFKFVNREQDLGDQGLRKAKLSYNPIDFLKKYKVVLK